MTTAAARVMVWSVAGWLAVLALMTFGIALFGEPDDGIMNASTWLGKAVVVAIAVVASWGSIGLLLLRRKDRLVAVPVLGVFALLSGLSGVEALSSKVRVASEVWPNVGMFVVCAISIGVLVRRSTWIAIERAGE